MIKKYKSKILEKTISDLRECYNLENFPEIKNGYVTGYLNKLGNQAYIVGELMEDNDEFVIFEYWYPVYEENIEEVSND